jgi:small-conductance mechanosensitive channel
MEILRKLLIDPLERCFDNLLLFLPNILTALVILLVGAGLSLLLKFVCSKVSRTLGVDQLARRMGLDRLLGKSGIRDPVSLVFAKFIAGLTMAVFAVMAVQSINVPGVDRLLEKFFLYLPNVFAALIILLVGYLLSNFLSRAALIGAVNAGIEISRLLARAVKYLVLVLSATMALEQLGIGSGTVVVAFAIVFSGIVLALAIAFGLGGRDAAKDYLEKKLNGKDRDDDIEHL